MKKPVVTGNQALKMRRFAVPDAVRHNMRHRVRDHFKLGICGESG
jgi:hypothetical protein